MKNLSRKIDRNFEPYLPAGRQVEIDFVYLTTGRSLVNKKCPCGAVRNVSNFYTRKGHAIPNFSCRLPGTTQKIIGCVGLETVSKTSTNKRTLGFQEDAHGGFYIHLWILLQPSVACRVASRYR